jgi:hypothetical protein
MPDDALIKFLYALLTNPVVLILMSVLGVVVLRNIIALDDDDMR